jgi:enamine deaminase RidA (YjgF/YER057c/UK114 family)
MSSNKPHAFNPPTVQEPVPTYKQVCVTPIVPSSKLITLAGQTATRKDGTVPSDIKEQAKGAYENIHNCLKAVGATPRDIIFVRHYIVKDTGNPELDGKDVVERGWGELWMEFMDREADGHRPPDTVVGVASLALEDLLYECEVWAMISS